MNTARSRRARVLALWFGAGLVPLAPGTAGSIAAIPLYLLLRSLGLDAVALGAAAVIALGIWSAGIVAQQTGLHDPQTVVIDEVAGVLCTLLAAPPGWPGTLAGLVLFRVFDQWKPWPARAAERELPPRWGIMLDDVFAAAWAALVLLGLRRLGWL